MNQQTTLGKSQQGNDNDISHNSLVVFLVLKISVTDTTTNHVKPAIITENTSSKQIVNWEIVMLAITYPNPYPNHFHFESLKFLKAKYNEIIANPKSASISIRLYRFGTPYTLIMMKINRKELKDKLIQSDFFSIFSPFYSDCPTNHAAPTANPTPPETMPKAVLNIRPLIPKPKSVIKPASGEAPCLDIQ